MRAICNLITHRNVASFIVICAIVLTAMPSAVAVTMAWSPVSDPGNFSDTTGFGAVGYPYRIGTYDVTNSQYVDFLNAKDPNGTSPLQLYNIYMSNAVFGGITYNPGAASGNKYTVISGRGDHPVNYATWYDAARFANWVNNGQGSGDTESGAYTLLGGTPTPSNGLSIARNPGATVFLPSEDEWYKAAYYDPATHAYFKYPTSSDVPPNATAPTAAPNSANYQGDQGNLTDVGAYSGTVSPSGAFDMSGNVWQWNEAVIYESFRGARGASYGADSTYMISSNSINYFNPSYENDGIGFRLASVPEPSTRMLAGVACGLMWMLRDAIRLTFRTAKCAEVHHRAIGIKKRMRDFRRYGI